jgi:hypothetical protein
MGILVYKNVGRTNQRTNHENLTSFIIKKMLDEPTNEPTTETLRPLLLGIDLTMHFISIDIEQLMESSYIELVVIHRDSHIP